MKFIVSKNENGHTNLRIANRCFYLNDTEMQSIISGKITFADDGAILKSDRWQMAIYPNIHAYSTGRNLEEEITAKTLIIRCDTQRMFKRIEEATERVGIDKRYEMDTRRFAYRNQIPEELTYVQILSHAGFHARKAISMAANKHKPELMKLRKILSDKLNAGFQIWEDWVDTPNFYFNGGAYNGGIIFHENHGYSVHT